MVGRSLAVAALALGLSARQADAHGAVTIPMPREAIDGDTAPWNGKVPWPIPFGASSSAPPVLLLVAAGSALPEMYICCVPPFG